MFYNFHLCPQFRHVQTVFLLDKPPKTVPTPGKIAVPIIARPTLNFLFVAWIEVLPHLGQQAIPAALFSFFLC